MKFTGAIRWHGEYLSSLVESFFIRIFSIAHIDDNMRKVITGAAGVLVLRSLGAGLTFGFNVLLGRLLGANGAGVYYMALTVTTIATVIGKAGMDNVLLRFAAANAAQRNWAEVARIARHGLLIATILSVLATVATLLLTPWLAYTIFEESALVLPLQIMSLSIVPQSLLILYGELLRALNRIRTSVLVQAIGVPLISLILLLVLAKIGGISGASGAYAIASLLILVFGALRWRGATPQVRGGAGQFSIERMISTGIPLFWVSLMTLAMNSASTILLGTWGTSREVGIFNIANRTALLTSFILIAINTIVAPRFAVLYEQKNLQALGKLARDSAKLMIVVAAPPTLFFIMAPRFVLQLFGSDFAEGGIVLAILALGQFVNVTTGSVGYLLMMTGHEKLVRNKTIVSMVVSLVLLTILIPAHGVVGAAIATAISVATDNLLSAGLVYRRLSILTLPVPGWRGY